jgi:hypothetical protein
MQDPVIIQEWFQRVQSTIEQYGIVTEDIYNFDETGFQRDVIHYNITLVHAQGIKAAFN